MKYLNKYSSYLAILFIFFLLPLQLGLSTITNTIYLSIGYLLIFLICKLLVLTKSDLGVSYSQFKKSIFPILIVLFAVFGVVSLVYMFNPEIFKDDRYDQSLLAALSYVFLILPIRTVLIEELVFRGILFERFSKQYSYKVGIIVSGLLFGLWHIASSRNIESDLIPKSFENFSGLILIVIIVISTGLVGAFLCELKRRFNSLYVPIFAHWAINGSAIIFAYLAWN